MSSVKQVQSIRNACTVVEAVAARHSIGVSELARVTGLDKSAVHRIAVTLHQAGWFQPAPGGRWQLTAAFGRVARSVDGGRLLSSMRPVLEELRDETSETVLLVTSDRQRFVVQAVVESPNAVRMSFARRSRAPGDGERSSPSDRRSPPGRRVGLAAVRTPGARRRPRPRDDPPARLGRQRRRGVPRRRAPSPRPCWHPTAIPQQRSSCAGRRAGSRPPASPTSANALPPRSSAHDDCRPAPGVLITRA